MNGCIILSREILSEFWSEKRNHIRTWINMLALGFLLSEFSGWTDAQSICTHYSSLSGRKIIDKKCISIFQQVWSWIGKMIVKSTKTEKQKANITEMKKKAWIKTMKLEDKKFSFLPTWVPWLELNDSYSFFFSCLSMRPWQSEM